MVVRAWLVVGILIIGVAWYLTVLAPPPDFQATASSPIDSYRKAGLMPQVGALKMSTAIGHEVFELPATDAEYLEEAAASQMASMPGMNMPGMNMGGDAKPGSPMQMQMGDTKDEPAMNMADGAKPGMQMQMDDAKPGSSMQMGDDKEKPAMQMAGDAKPGMQMQMGDTKDEPAMKMADGAKPGMQMPMGDAKPGSSMQMQMGDDKEKPAMKMADGAKPGMQMPMGEAKPGSPMQMQMGDAKDKPHDEPAMQMAGAKPEADHGDEAEAGHGGEEQEAAGGHGGGGGIALVSAGSGTPIDRTIEIKMAEWGYTPGTVMVKPGEVIRFVITNAGTLPHEFMIMTGPGMGAVNYRIQRADWSLTEHEAIYENPLVMPGDTFETVLKIEQPGMWMFMCMFPYHMRLGMMGMMMTEGMAGMNMGGMKM